MTQDNQPHSETEEDQPCCVCTNIPDEYIQLACEHNYCLSCLAQLLLSQSQDPESQVVVSCALCQNLTELDPQTLETLQIQHEQSQQQSIQQESFVQHQNYNQEGGAKEESQEIRDSTQFHQNYKQNNKMMNSKFFEGAQPEQNVQFEVTHALSNQKLDQIPSIHPIYQVNQMNQNKKQPMINQFNPSEFNRKNDFKMSNLEIQRMKYELGQQIDFSFVQSLQVKINSLQESMQSLDKNKRKFTGMLQEYQDEIFTILFKQVQEYQKMADSYFVQEENQMKHQQNLIQQQIDFFSVSEDILQGNDAQQILSLQQELGNIVKLRQRIDIKDYLQYEDKQVKQTLENLKNHVQNFNFTIIKEQTLPQQPIDQQYKVQDLHQHLKKDSIAEHPELYQLLEKNKKFEEKRKQLSSDFQIINPKDTQILKSQLKKQQPLKISEFERNFDNRYQQILQQNQQHSNLKQNNFEEEDNFDNISNYEMKSPLYTKDFKPYPFPITLDHYKPQEKYSKLESYKDKESFKDQYTSKEQYKDSLKEQYKDSFKDQYKDLYKDQYKDQYKSFDYRYGKYSKGNLSKYPNMFESRYVPKFEHNYSRYTQPYYHRHF